MDWVEGVKYLGCYFIYNFIHHRVIAELSKNIKIITTNTKCTVHHYDDSLS